MVSVFACPHSGQVIIDSNSVIETVDLVRKAGSSLPPTQSRYPGFYQ